MSFYLVASLLIDNESGRLIKIWVVDLQRSAFSGHDWEQYVQGVAGTKT